MKAKLIQIGNSKGIRLPKSVLDQCDLQDEVELEIENNYLIITPVSKIRSGWDQAFTEMAEKGDDALIDKDVVSTTEWDETEWEW
jgi:antitoxin MazE